MGVNGCLYLSLGGNTHQKMCDWQKCIKPCSLTMLEIAIKTFN